MKPDLQSICITAALILLALLWAGLAAWKRNGGAIIHNKRLFAEDPATPVWRVGIIALVARALGVLVHVEGLPVGSNRLNRRYPKQCEREG